jgi:Raf kinase inhibitor-like YbhB/YbcL family protein
MGDEFHLTSSSFKDGGHIPRKHTAEGTVQQKDISPQLAWHNVPEGTESLALIVDDPDAPDPEAPVVPWVHWIVVNIPPTLHGLPEGFRVHGLEESEIKKEHQGIHEGYNDFKQPGYRGPAPPTSAPHRYEFKLYALDKKFEKLPHKITKPVLEDAMEGHILGEAKLTGLHGHERTGPRGTDSYIPPGFPMTEAHQQR